MVWSDHDIEACLREASGGGDGAVFQLEWIIHDDSLHHQLQRMQAQLQLAAGADNDDFAVRQCCPLADGDVRITLNQFRLTSVAEVRRVMSMMQKFRRHHLEPLLARIAASEAEVDHQFSSLIGPPSKHHKGRLAVFSCLRVFHGRVIYSPASGAGSSLLQGVFDAFEELLSAASITTANKQQATSSNRSSTFAPHVTLVKAAPGDSLPAAVLELAAAEHSKVFGSQPVSEIALCVRHKTPLTIIDVLSLARSADDSSSRLIGRERDPTDPSAQNHRQNTAATTTTLVDFVDKPKKMDRPLVVGGKQKAASSVAPEAVMEKQVLPAAIAQVEQWINLRRKPENNSDGSSKLPRTTQALLNAIPSIARVRVRTDTKDLLARLIASKMITETTLCINDKKANIVNPDMLVPTKLLHPDMKSGWKFRKYSKVPKGKEDEMKKKAGAAVKYATSLQSDVKAYQINQVPLSKAVRRAEKTDSSGSPTATSVPVSRNNAAGPSSRSSSASSNRSSSSTRGGVDEDVFLSTAKRSERVLMWLSRVADGRSRQLKQGASCIIPASEFMEQLRGVATLSAAPAPEAVLDGLVARRIIAISSSATNPSAQRSAAAAGFGAVESEVVTYL